MIIFKDKLSGDELFSDAYPHKTEEDNFILTVKAKLESRKGDTIDESKLGANASQEEQSEGVDDPSTKSGLDIELNHKLQNIDNILSEKKDVQAYLKKYIKNLKTKLEEEDPDKAQKFVEAAKNKFSLFFKKWTKGDSSIYIGENFECFANETAALMIGNWDEDGKGVTFYLLADGIEAEKQ